MPFHQFTIEQLAGNILPKADLNQKGWVPQGNQDTKVATGFVRSFDAEYRGWNRSRRAELDCADRSQHTPVGNVWLGSTTQCTQCHNHKYDPFTQKQFYQMVAFFNNAKFGGNAPPPDPNDPDPAAANPGRRNFNEGTLDIATPEQAQKRDALGLKSAPGRPS